MKLDDKPTFRHLDGLADPSIIGADLRRLEDARFLTGGAQFLADIRLAGMREAAFVRSMVAHGRIRRISPPASCPPDALWTARDLAELVQPMVARVLRDGFRDAPYHPLATDRVRFVGEAVCAVLADDLDGAIELAESVQVEIDALPAIVDALDALKPDAARIHEGWPDNVYLTIKKETAGFDAAARAADVHVRRAYRMARAGPMPIETRGCVAWLDRRNDQLVLWTTTQRPHLIRTILARHLAGFDERRIRVIVPDVGGAFGGKGNFYPEELALAALALKSRHPVRWIETRSEHMLAASQAREQCQTVTAHAMRDGTLVGVEIDIVGDAGAYSMLTSTGVVEPNMAASVLPGPYRLPNYRYVARSVCTNKTPVGPYRGVGRPAGVFAMERTIDELARELGMTPNAVRSKNVVRPDELPWTTVTGLKYDSADFPALIRSAEEAIGAMGQATSIGAHEKIGTGYAMYVEQTAHGVTEWVTRGAAFLSGFECARVTLDGSGSLTVDVGVISQGQGHETSLAQIAAAVSGVPLSRIRVRQGDTGFAPYGMGTVASRSIVMAGGAVYHACTKLVEKLKAIAASTLECAPAQVTLCEGVAFGPCGRVDYSSLADIAWQKIHKLPAGVQPGLEFLHVYRPEIETGTFASGMHAARVAVDLETGGVRVLDYVVVEDCGRQINPMIVAAQAQGGVVQGIGQALFEAFRYDESGQPLAGSFMDYALPRAGDVPGIGVEHQCSVSSFGLFGMKGTGEGGAVAPPAAIANAVCSALEGLNIGVSEVPLTGQRMWQAIRAAGPTRTYV